MPAVKLDGRVYEEVIVRPSPDTPFEVDIVNATINATVGDVKISNTSAEPVPISDASGSLTVDSPALTSIDAKLPALVDGKLPVAASISIAGNATEAKQNDIINAIGGVDQLLTDVDASTTSIDAKLPGLNSGKVPVIGPVTDAELRASAIPVSPDVQKGTGVTTLTTTRVVLSNDSPGVPTLSSIDGKLPTLVDGKVPVSATISITGNATEAKQDSIITGITGVNTLLTSIDGDTGSIDSKLPALSGGKVPVVGPLTDAELRAAAVPVSVDTQKGAGATTASTARVALATDSPGVSSLANIDGKLPALVDGKVPVSATINMTGAATEAKQDSIISGIGGVDTRLTSIDGKLPALVSGKVPISGTVVVTGSATEAKQDYIVTELQGVNTKLGTIDVDTGSIDAKLPSLAAGRIPVAGPLTDTELRASAVAVTPDVQKGSGVTTASTTRVALSSDSPGISSLSSIDGKMPALIDGKIPVTANVTITGNATEAKQDSTITAIGGLNTLLTSIDGDTGAISAKLPDLNLGKVPVIGPLTDTELRASAIPVSPSIQQGAGVITATTTRVALASDSPGISSLSSVDAKLPSLDSGKVPVVGPLTDTQLRASSIAVSDGGGSLTVDGTVKTLAGLEIPAHDKIELAYTGANLTTVVYKVGVTTAATLTLAYDGSGNLTTVTKS